MSRITQSITRRVTRTFVVERRALATTRWAEHPHEPLPDGAVRVSVDAFALTSNNITYAAFGEAMQYWNFFPTGDPTTGCIPVWGFAVVADSRCEGVAVGERFYGYLPMASDVVLHPARIDAAGFVDGAAHRRDLHGVYNRYVRCSTDPGYVQTREAEQALLRPLFTTSFLIDDFLADNQFFGAGSVILSSASSKTAYGTASMLSRRRGADAQTPRIIGLTSPANLEFTRGLGCYDLVLPYAEARALPTDTPSAYVDFSGDAQARALLHGHLAEQLVYSCSVGGTHWEALGGGKGLPGPRPVLFFAPAQATKRVADWGPTVLTQRIADAWAAFMLPVTDARRPWLRVVHGRGEAAVQTVYADLVAGRIDPQLGHLLTV